MRDPNDRLIKRLRGVSLLAFERLRRPGGWDGRRGNRYRHELIARGPDVGFAGEWDVMQCRIEVNASRPDPVLRVLGSPPIRCDETSFILTHQTRVHFHAPLPLDIYVEANDAEEILVIAAGVDPGRAKWTAPVPRWID